MKLGSRTERFQFTLIVLPFTVCLVSHTWSVFWKSRWTQPSEIHFHSKLTWQTWASFTHRKSLGIGMRESERGMQCDKNRGYIIYWIDCFAIFYHDHVWAWLWTWLTFLFYCHHLGACFIAGESCKVSINSHGWKVWWKGWAIDRKEGMLYLALI